ncbi:alpha-humulene synthase-like [Cryptomeria japonica]|uniref:alpha-humulene synthase-like n=1 Tax=Cryptomeria japonica TaxID=3369 RepID=UPI0025AD9C95|nr:alpha-humulene synthase-like [Cryptomeria japonica]
MSLLMITCLYLRLVRLNRYHVSADTLKSFKDNNGQFILCGVNNDKHGNNIKEEHVMRIMLNLLRVSSVAYPREILMEEAKVFSTEYLEKLLENLGDTYKRSFLKEVEYALVYEWPRTFTRWEVERQEDFRACKIGFQYSTISVQVGDEKTLKLVLFWAVSSIAELELSSSRLALEKATTIITIMDDIFDDYATLEQLKCITEAIAQGWDVSIIKDIPRNLKTCIEFIFKTVLELTSDATEKQGHDMMPFVTKADERLHGKTA